MIYNDRYFFLNFFYFRYFFLLKYSFLNIYDLPEINWISLSINFNKNFLLKDYVLIGLFFLFLISNGQKGSIIYSKKNNKPVGCKLLLENKKDIYIFLEKLGSIYLLNLKNFKGFNLKNFNNNFSFTLHDLSIFPEIEENLEMFIFLNSLNISIFFDLDNFIKNSNYLSLYNIYFNLLK